VAPYRLRYALGSWQLYLPFLCFFPFPKHRRPPYVGISDRGRFEIAPSYVVVATIHNVPNPTKVAERLLPLDLGTLIGVVLGNVLVFGHRMGKDEA
jgi:hypothetical protein